MVQPEVALNESSQGGPNPRFREPGGQGWTDGFSMSLAAGPFHFGTPEEYARGKALEFPDEGGAVILVVDVSEDIVARAINESFPSPKAWFDSTGAPA